MADAVSSPGDGKKRAKPRKAAKTFKVTRFDRDAARLMQTGGASLGELVRRLGVDSNSAAARLATLVGRGYFVQDPTSGRYALGVEGYNKFASRLKNARPSGSPDGKGSPEAGIPARLPDVQPSKQSSGTLVSPEARPDVIELLDASRKSRENAQVKPEPAALPQVDLAALLAKGAPGGRVLKKDGSMCELCRADFRVSVKEPQSAKFAHCVCGSAYHKDCYQSLVDGSAGCARCGRKLSTVLDQLSLEALKTVKDAFE